MSDDISNSRTLNDARMMAECLAEGLSDAAAVLGAADRQRRPLPPKALHKLKVMISGGQQLIEDLQSGYYEPRQ